jgi:hypothetical protein
VLLRTPHRAPIHLAPSRPWRAPRPAEDIAAGRGGLHLCLGVRWAALDVPPDPSLLATTVPHQVDRGRWRRRVLSVFRHCF